MKSLVLSLFLVFAHTISSQTYPTLRLGPKPSDTVPERKTRVQPNLPEGVQEIPFIETSPAPMLSEAEKERGYPSLPAPCHGVCLSQYSSTS